MNRVGVAVALGLATGALAAPAPRPTWADWVGDYAGTLRWKGCFTPGAARANVSLDAIDGALVIELVDAGGGLRAMSLVEHDGGGWSAQQGDVTLRVQRPRANTLVLDAEVGTDCRMHAQLVRPSTKIAGCDRLNGWARVEAKCTKLTDPRLEDLAKLAIEAKKWKPREARRCEKRAATLELSLFDAGCAPFASRMAVVGPQCQALATEAAKLGRCASASRLTVEQAESLAHVPLTADTPAERELIESDCAGLRRLVKLMAFEAHCPL